MNPTKQRYVKSYEVRWAFHDTVQHPPDVTGVEKAIDLHCHANPGQQDPIALAKYASKSGMGGILYKTITFDTPPMIRLSEVQEALHRWSDAEKVKPIECWAGALTDLWTGGLSPSALLTHLKAGVRAVWMPTASHANTISQVGGKPFWWGGSKNRGETVGPMPMEQVLSLGALYILKDGKLDPRAKEIVHLCQDFNVPLFFGHLTHEEQDALAEEVVRIGFQKAVIDHPFSPFVDLTIEKMKELADAGFYMNFTYDELSPLLGVDPFEMYQAIRAVGCHRVTLSSDAGESLFPNTVECMRLMRTYMRAFGLTLEEIHQVSVTNPRHLLGV